MWDASTFSQHQQRLLQHQTAELFFAHIVGLAHEHHWVSDAHFTVDGTLVGAWASLKSFRPKTGAPPPAAGDPGNPSVDFHSECRSNATHESTTDPEARLMRKAKGKEAKLCFGLHALMENRHGLCVQAQVTTSVGVTETTTATALLARQIEQADRAPQTVGADKGYHNAELVDFCREHAIVPHIAPTKTGMSRAWTGAPRARSVIKPAKKCASGSKRSSGGARKWAACAARANAAWTGWA